MNAILNEFEKISLLKTFVEKHCQHRGNTCRYSLDVVQIIAICAVLFLSPSNSRSNFFYINFPEKHRTYLFYSLCQL